MARRSRYSHVAFAQLDKLTQQSQDCALHPSEPVVAAALISGRLCAHRFDAADGSSAPAFRLKVTSSTPSSNFRQNSLDHPLAWHDTDMATLHLHRTSVENTPSHIMPRCMCAGAQGVGAGCALLAGRPPACDCVSGPVPAGSGRCYRAASCAQGGCARHRHRQAPVRLRRRPRFRQASLSHNRWARPCGNGLRGCSMAHLLVSCCALAPLLSVVCTMAMQGCWQGPAVRHAAGGRHRQLCGCVTL